MKKFVAVAGNIGVGKSTLVNAILGEERVIAFDQPGTTRDWSACYVKSLAGNPSLNRSPKTHILPIFIAI